MVSGVLEVAVVVSGRAVVVLGRVASGVVVGSRGLLVSMFCSRISVSLTVPAWCTV